MISSLHGDPLLFFARFGLKRYAVLLYTGVSNKLANLNYIELSMA
jgi:hypothetical protein